MIRKALPQLAFFALVIGATVIGGVSGCSQTESDVRSATPDSPVAYETPLKDASTIRAELHSACETAVTHAKPLLVEFSAPWCSDCQRLHEMKQSGPLAEEIDRWPVVVINVDQFDHHRDLLEGFGVRKIAHWAVLEPTDCSRPAERWRRRIQRTLEPASGDERSRTPADLARWLRDLRES